MTARPYSPPTMVLLAAEALAALVLARLVLPRTRPDNVLRRNRAAARRGVRQEERGIADGCTRIGFIIPRLAPRLPWRADCLVQALAGQRMLMRRGIASAIVVGTARHPDGSFEAHAWLTCGERVVLGGDIARFAPLLDSAGEGELRR